MSRGFAKISVACCTLITHFWPDAIFPHRAADFGPVEPAEKRDQGWHVRQCLLSILRSG
jgi:hypothetical protein